MLEAVLIVAAVVAGVTGAWSPCGLSMVETLAPSGYAERLRTSLVACVTFGVGALAGGVVTFGGLALVGAAIGGGSALALVAGIALAAAAGIGELRGTRIVPQVRRQVPESWRRILPVPVAAGLYGVLLGLGFTTFILSFAVWALAGLSVALGDPELGLLIGLGFGAGRALPVIVLAPASGTRAGAAVHAAMAERPAIYRSLRLLDAGAMLACAGVLWAGPAQAARAADARPAQVPRLVTTTAAPATDPSAGSGALAWQEPGRAGRLRRPGSDVTLPGRDPVVDGNTIAWRDGDVITFAALGDLTWQSSEVAPGADAYGFSDGWLVWRAPRLDGGQLLLARRRSSPDTPPRTLESSRPAPTSGARSSTETASSTTWPAPAAAASSCVTSSSAPPATFAAPTGCCTPTRHSRATPCCTWPRARVCRRSCRGTSTAPTPRCTPSPRRHGATPPTSRACGATPTTDSSAAATAPSLRRACRRGRAAARR